MKKVNAPFIITLMLLFLAGTVFARNFRVSQLPNGSKNGCVNCHINPQGGGARDAFGTEVGTNYLSGGNVVWNIELASLDSDGDKVPNGVELQDPLGTWVTGQPNPGDNSMVTLPGTETSFKEGLLSIIFNEMTPHIGQKLELRLINQSVPVEISRTSINAIPAAKFIAVLNDLTPGSNYSVDFYADLSGNSQYDPPPTDHAWQILLNNNTDSVMMVNFTYNTNYVDINWPTAIIASPTAGGLPNDFSLAQNYPNPFNPITHIQFNLSHSSQVRIDVFNLSGQLIRSLCNTELPAGAYSVSWDGLDQSGRQVGSGMYFYQMSSPDFVQARRMVLVK
jgi:hypothetical protein